MSGWRDGARLAVGTLSVLPTRPPSRVDAGVAGRAMLLGPLVGLVLGALVGVPAGLLVGLDRSPLLVSALAVAALAWLTRALHLDGLADVADGLGSGRDGEAARAIMKKSDIGPFGVATLVLALLAQVAAAAVLLAQDALAGAVLVGVVVLGSRCVLPWLCTARFPAATPSGLGALVAGTVRGGAAAGALAVAALVGAGALGADAVRGDLAGGSGVLLAGLVGVLAGQLAAYGLARRCLCRFGGTTGDVLGACVETALTVGLVAAALVV